MKENLKIKTLSLDRSLIIALTLISIKNVTVGDVLRWLIDIFEKLLIVDGSGSSLKSDGNGGILGGILSGFLFGGGGGGTFLPVGKFGIVPFGIFDDGPGLDPPDEEIYPEVANRYPWLCWFILLLKHSEQRQSYDETREQIDCLLFRRIPSEYWLNLDNNGGGLEAISWDLLVEVGLSGSIGWLILVGVEI